MNFVKKKIFNVIRENKEKFPSLLSIELSNICNATCIMCPRDEMTRKMQNMTMDTFKKIVAGCKNKRLKKINMFWFGESFCNKNIIEYLTYIRKELPNVKLYISTNAGLMNEEHSKAIIDNELLDVINFDIDGIKKETYENIRLRVNFDTVMKNTLFFLDYKKSKGKTKPQTRATIIKMKPTENEIDGFVKYWKPLVDRVDVNDYNTWLGTREDLNTSDKIEYSKNGKFDFACTHPWNEMVISTDGRAGICCLDIDLKGVIGNINKNSIQEIWQGEEINHYRTKMLKQEYQDLDVCKNCNAFIYQDKEMWAKLQK